MGPTLIFAFCPGPGHPGPEGIGSGAAFASLCEAIPDGSGRKTVVKQEEKQISKLQETGTGTAEIVTRKAAGIVLKMAKI